MWVVMVIAEVIVMWKVGIVLKEFYEFRDDKSRGLKDYGVI